MLLPLEEVMPQVGRLLGKKWEIARKGGVEKREKQKGRKRMTLTNEPFNRFCNGLIIN